MKFTALAFLTLAIGTTALPVPPSIQSRATSASPYTTTQILQLALTLEHLESAFYTQALSSFTAANFTAAGFPDSVRERFLQISEHESQHVKLLSSALGNDSVQPCTYAFDGRYKDVGSFIGLASVIENLGVSAYAGAAQYITDPVYATVASTILSTEARHQAWQNAAVLGQNPWGSPYDTVLTPDMVFTIASELIASCPSTNPTLPFKTYPLLTVNNEVIGSPGDHVVFTFADNHTEVNYAIFYSGLGAQAVQLDENDFATVPSTLQGISYVVISTASDPANVTSDSIVAGPATLDYTFAANVTNSGFTGGADPLTADPRF
ncbi:MAG: hypothetical protein TREMPRED_002313 [Tremellales sp. Tagirdzhanova-0007]|nr:MAG: hypothetical protein TREMPRED_002313 [Tremellales sp. Tagirdzhanova-0007]